MIILKRIFFFISTIFIFQSVSFANITDPELFDWTFHPVSATNPSPYYSGTMTIAEATFNIGGESMTTRAYGQEGKAHSIPGPTMVMKPGNKYVLHFKNLLPFEEKETAHNVFKDPNVSNLHTHGLHISGMSPGDDVTRSFEGGFAGDFVYDIPADHMGGTYWYHAHHHGSTFLQVSGGAFGLLIIDDSLDGIPQNVANMQEQHLVLGFLDPAAAGTGGDTLIRGTLSPTWTVNGFVGGSTSIPKNTWQHWRILLADRDAKSKAVSLGEQCEVALMARDGVWRTQVPKILATKDISLTGASRADLAVRCSANSSININGNKVADIIIAGTTDTSVHPYAQDGTSTWSAIRPSYLRDLRSHITSNTETIKLGARTINGSKYDHHIPTFTLQTDGVQQWQLQGAAMHPFHLHIYHVQVVGDCGDYEDGEYYDVVSGNCKIRFDLNPSTSSVFQGRTVMHCHILQHEDQGAMGWANVLGGTGAPTFPVDSGNLFSEYYSFDNGSTDPIPYAPTALVSSPLSSSDISLQWSDNSLDETSFEIERSIDGVQFSAVSSVPADTSAYIDSGLNASTQYTYRVFAKNAAGNSEYSNTANATTDEPVPGVSMQVGSITLSTTGIGKGQKIGNVSVVVLDDQGNFVSNALVSGEFTGSLNETVTTGGTDSTGTTTVSTSNSVKRMLSLQFCVTAINHATLQDYSAQPGQVCASL
jgi:suppressor of ftsI